MFLGDVVIDARSIFLYSVCQDWAISTSGT